VPSFILIRQTVSPQYTNVRDRTGQTDRQQSDSIGRTVLQTVAQKLNLTQQKHAFTNQKKYTTTQNEHKKHAQSPFTTSGLEAERDYSYFGAS